MSSAQFTVGLAEDSRITSKVLKPPGGGSSDIFGTHDDKAPTHVVKKHNSSQFSLGNGDEETMEQQVAAAVANKADSVDSASVSSQASTNGTPENSEPNTPRSGTPLLNGPLAYDNHVLPTPSRPHGRRQGNPVTGAGYGDDAAAAEKKEETPRRQRVPPGGFSSKLW